MSSAPPSRRLVLCLDGTWNSTYERQHRDDGSEVLKPTNVLKLCRAVKPWDEISGRQQIAYYDVGVGALAKFPGFANRLLHLADRALGGGFGAGIEAYMEAALDFLAMNFQPEDEVFLFGFSRGAATAQGVSRFLDWSGGLPEKKDAYYLPILFRAYLASRGRRPVAEVMAAINESRAKYKRQPVALESFRPVTIEYLGLWDTVMALGSRFRVAGERTSSPSRSFHVDVKPARVVRHARQALAIDEARYDFRPEIWTSCQPGQTLEQCWFAGVHSNVGGGYVDDGLANLAFHWIQNGAQAHGLATDSEVTKHYRGFAMDRLYRSESLFYRAFDAVRRRMGRGRRPLDPPSPEANLTLAPSVIHRLAADPHEKKTNGDLRYPDMKGRPYRPRNLLRLLAGQNDLETYLHGLGLKPEQCQLPEDVLAEIARLRRR